MIRKAILTIMAVLVAAAGYIYFFVLPPISLPLGALFGAEIDESDARQRIELPDGFVFTIFARDVERARFMEVTATDDIIAVSGRSGEIVLLYGDADNDGMSDGREVLLAGLDGPNDVLLLDGWLYFSEKTSIGRVKYDAQQRRMQGDVQRILEGLPEGGTHTRKTLGHRDGWIYFNVGSSCNVCIEDDERRATIMRVHLDGASPEIYARGLRNSMGMDWSPETGEFIATDHGRDLLGDNFPPEEVNRIEQGKFYGWPFVNGFGDPDPDFGDQGSDAAQKTVQPVHGMAAHNAPLGIRFLRNGGYPDDYHHDALVALHGSWNRSKKDGYKVVRLSWSADGSVEQSDFMTGFLVKDDVIARPVDIVEDSQGRIYISDDYAGAIYRVEYGGTVSASAAVEMPQAPTGKAPEFTAMPGQVSRGLELYDELACAACHGDLGLANGSVPLDLLREKYTQRQLIELLKSPPASMPPVELDDESLEAISAYLLMGQSR